MADDPSEAPGTVTEGTPTTLVTATRTLDPRSRFQQSLDEPGERVAGRTPPIDEEVEP